MTNDGSIVALFREGVCAGIPAPSPALRAAVEALNPSVAENPYSAIDRILKCAGALVESSTWIAVPAESYSSGRLTRDALPGWLSVYEGLVLLQKVFGASFAPVKGGMLHKYGDVWMGVAVLLAKASQNASKTAEGRADGSESDKNAAASHCKPLQAVSAEGQTPRKDA